MFRLMNEQGEARATIIDIKVQCEMYFSGLFSWTYNMLGYKPWFPHVVTRSMNIWLSRISKEEEINSVITKLNVDQVLGPDGFTSHIFQACWGIMKDEIVTGITHLFMSQSMV